MPLIHFGDPDGGQDFMDPVGDLDSTDPDGDQDFGDAALAVAGAWASAAAGVWASAVAGAWVTEWASAHLGTPSSMEEAFTTHTTFTVIDITIFARMWLITPEGEMQHPTTRTGTTPVPEVVTL